MFFFSKLSSFRNGPLQYIIRADRCKEEIAFFGEKKQRPFTKNGGIYPAVMIYYG